jgi:hypothetical protein
MLPSMLLSLLIGHAAPADAEAQARAALALAVASHHTPAPIHNQKHDQMTMYERLRARAVAENRPLIVWVGLYRPDLERARPDALHYHSDRFPGATPPRVVVGRPAGGELWRAADLPAAAVDALRPAAAVCGPGGCR